MEELKESPTKEGEQHVLAIADFRRFFFGNVLASFGMQMQATAVGWEIYERTGSPLALGYVGLIQFLPLPLLVIPAGQLADRFDRKKILQIASFLIAIGAFGLALISKMNGPVEAIYFALFWNGLARGLGQPARAALASNIVPVALFPKAVAWNTGGFHLASVAGPALAGTILAATGKALPIYLFEAFALLFQFGLLTRMAPRPPQKERSAVTWETLVGGFTYLWRAKLILAAISLDLFAVILGGATTLIPVYAKDILEVGAEGLGWLRAAPALGALAMAIFLTQQPSIRRAGPILLLSVFAFGMATIVFGLSRSYPLSLAMLFATGAFDQISVVLRHTLVQLETPNEMRGRVSAVSFLFIGASNELGGYESGLLAYLVSPIFSVVSGGIGTMLVVAVTAWLCPPLRHWQQKRHGDLR